MSESALSGPRASYDVVVIGGGPGGSTSAAILAEGGHSVLVLEAAKFPRFAVGEIVAPTGLWRVWHRLGITQETLDSLFIRKWAGGWQSPDGVVFRFDQDVHPDDGRCRAFVYTFERAVYDDFLLQHARTKGVDAREEAFVQDLLQDETGRVTGVRFRDASGVHEVRSKVVIDASGRQNLVGKKLGIRMDLVELKSFSVFAHWEGGRRNEGQEEGDVRIVFGQDMWFWWAPLKAPKVSIGIVSNREKFYEEYLELGPEAYYEKYIPTCPFIWDRIKDGQAKRISNFKPIEKGTGQSTLVDYHYVCTQMYGDGWVLVGDAAGFVDPIFSAGLHVSQTSAMWLAEELLASWDDHQAAYARYKERYDSEIATVMRHIQRYATDYFDPKFVNFYLNLGSRIPRIRKLYIDTFVAYDKNAVAQYTQLIDRYFKSRTPPPQEVIDQLTPAPVYEAESM